MPVGKSKSDYSGFKRPEHRSLVDIAFDILTEAIINQELQPNEQISIDNLAKQLNMSNTPVREALMRAHGEGLVRQKINRGFIVTPLLTRPEIRQMFDVRYLLETHAISVASLPIEHIKPIQNIVKQMRLARDGSAYDDYKDYLLLDHQLHRALVALSGNNFLVKSWEDLHVHLHLSRLYAGVGLHDRDDSAREHEEILVALESGNRVQMVTKLSQHIKDVEKRLEGFLEHSS